MSNSTDLREDKGTDSASMEQSSPIPKELAEKLMGFCVSQAIITSFNLGIFDVLHKAKVPRTVIEITEELKTDKDATERLLNTLVSLELLKKEAKDSMHFYSNTSTADKFLVKNSVNSIKGLMPMLEKSYKLYGNLEHAVREGSNQWKRIGFFYRLIFMLVDLYSWLHKLAFNWFQRRLVYEVYVPLSWDMFSFISATKRGLMLFLEGLRGSCKPEAERLMSAFDLSKYSTMCDLGGATGDLAYAAGNLYPGMAITVFDLPAVIQCAPSFQPSTYECTNQHNICFKSGDFFEDPLPSTDLYVLTRILQSFDECKITKLLNKVSESLPSGGGILICEKVLDDDKSGPLLGNLSSLSMLVAGNKGSRERSGEEYKSLLQECGFCNVRIQQNVGTFMDAILADKNKYFVRDDHWNYH